MIHGRFPPSEQRGDEILRHCGQLSNTSSLRYASLADVVREDRGASYYSRNNGRAGLRRVALLREAVGLRDRTERDRMVDVDAARVERLAVELEQSGVLDLRLEHPRGSCRRQAFRFLE